MRDLFHRNVCKLADKLDFESVLVRHKMMKRTVGKKVGEEPCETL